MERERRGRRPVASLTDSQRRALLEVQAFVDRHKFPPTVQELAEVLGVSGASAHAQIGQLVRKGYIKREPRKARGLSVVREPEDTPLDLVPVPLVGTVVAGRPVLAEENVIGEVLVEGRLARPGRCFALRVTGDSMANAGIADRDVIIVRQQPIAESGDIVVALLHDEATVKRLVIRADRIELRPENRNFQSIVIGPEDDLRVLGKVVAIRRASDRPNRHTRDGANEHGS